jgi:hypothetical protein
VVVGGPPDLVGATIQVIDIVTIDGETVSMPRPIPGVPEYVSVARSEAAANALRPRLTENLERKGRTTPHQPDLDLVIEFQSAAGTAVASAITSLEAYSNHQLAGVTTPAGPGGVILYDGRPYTIHQVRNMALNDRYADVMPAVMGVSKPTQEPWWPKLRQVQRLAAFNRHAVTEPTGGKGLSGADSLLQRFCNGEYKGTAQMLLDAFEHYSPGWISPERLAQLPSPPEVEP